MDLTLTAETGRIAGSRSSTRLRAEGRVPGVVYGLGRDAVAITVAWPELRRALSTEAGTNALITIDVDGQRDLAIVKDLQRHPVKRSVLHIDFLRVDPDALVAIDVPIVLVGEARQVDNRRGIVDQPLKTLTVRAKPTDIPSQLEAEISDLDIGDSITVGDLVLPAGVITDVEPETQVVLGVATRFSVQLDHGGTIADLEAADAAEEAAARGGAPAEAVEADAE
jgi:large subunit ribosomal protein L25